MTPVKKALLCLLALALLLPAFAMADQHIFPAMIEDVYTDGSITVTPIGITPQPVHVTLATALIEMDPPQPGMLVDVYCAGFDTMPGMVAATILRRARYEGTVQVANAAQSSIRVHGPTYGTVQVRLPEGTPVDDLLGQDIIFYPTPMDGERYDLLVAADAVELVRRTVGVIETLAVDHLMLATEDGQTLRVNLRDTAIPYSIVEGNTVEVVYQTLRDGETGPETTALSVWIING